MENRFIPFSIFILIVSILFVFNSCTTQNKTELQKVKKIGIISFGSRGTDYTDLGGIKGRKFADVTREVGSTMYLYRRGIRQISSAWFNEFLPELLKCTIQQFEKTARIKLVPVEVINTNRLYQSLRNRCYVHDALTANPNLGFLDEDCARGNLLQLQQELQVDALLFLDCELCISDLSMSFEPDIHVYRNGNCIYKYSYVSYVSKTILEGRYPFKSKDNFVNSIKEILEAAVPGGFASGEQERRMLSYLHEEFMSLSVQAGQKIADTLMLAVSDTNKLR